MASSASRRPLVAKLVSDPAYERARRWGLFDGTLEDFQHAGGTRLTALKRARTRALARARTLIVPSRYLAEIARGWNLDPKRLHVVPNPAPPARAATSTERTGLVFAGRLTRQKAMHVALDALAYVPTTALTIIGDGPDRARLERHAHDAGLNGRVRFVGSLPREEVLDALAGAEAAVLSSDWENFPHAAVEALAVGTPMVATTVGGVGEIVSDGVNGLLVPPGSPEAFGHALQRLLESPELQHSPLRRSPRVGARAGRRQDLQADRAAVAGGGPVVTDESAEPRRPRILMVGRMTYTLPLPGWLARKFDALERQLDYASSRPRTRAAAPSDDRFHLLQRSRIKVLDGVLFYLRLPFHVRRQINEFRPEAIIAESPYTAAPALVGRAMARGKAADRDRGARRLADGDSALRIAVAPRPLAARRRRRPDRAPPRRRRPRAVELHGRASSRTSVGSR